MSELVQFMHLYLCTLLSCRHFTEAAEKGHADACFALGEMYEFGHVSKVPPRNFAHAESWCELLGYSTNAGNLTFISFSQRFLFFLSFLLGWHSVTVPTLYCYIEHRPPTEQVPQGCLFGLNALCSSFGHFLLLWANRRATSTCAAEYFRR